MSEQAMPETPLYTHEQQAAELHRLRDDNMQLNLRIAALIEALRRAIDILERPL